MIPPKVTIIMATYNRAHFIMETLESVQAQTFLNWECLIIDDGGTDNTKEVIESILEKDNRFQFLERSNDYEKGLPGCRNYGLDMSKGMYIIFFDDDDIIHPDNLKIGIEVIEANNSDFCHYQKKSFENQKPLFKNIPITIVKSILKEDLEKVITCEIGLASCTVLWKKECFDTIRFNESLFYAEELECYSKIISENFKGIIIDNVLYYNRKHTNSNTGEFYSLDPIRRASFGDAILLIVDNLIDKKLLTNSLTRFFVTISINYKEYNLFLRILNKLSLSFFDKLKWQIFYNTFRIRLFIYQIKEKLNK